MSVRTTILALVAVAVTAGCFAAGGRTDIR